MLRVGAWSREEFSSERVEPSFSMGSKAVIACSRVGCQVLNPRKVCRTGKFIGLKGSC